MRLPRILVAEDERIIALDLCYTVMEAGYIVEGPHSNLASAALAIQKCKPDAAILDLSLHDGETFQLAEYLTAEQVPVIFHTGRYSSAEMAHRFPFAFTCDKPSPPAQILTLLRQALDT